jgi:hypothetical protein
METLKSQGYYQECSLASQSFAVFFVNGTAVYKTNITKLKICPCEKTQFQGQNVSEIDR